MHVRVYVCVFPCLFARLFVCLHAFTCIPVYASFVICFCVYMYKEKECMQGLETALSKHSIGTPPERYCCRMAIGLGGDTALCADQAWGFPNLTGIRRLCASRTGCCRALGSFYSQWLQCDNGTALRLLVSSKRKSCSLKHFEPSPPGRQDQILVGS